MCTFMIWQFNYQAIFKFNYQAILNFCELEVWAVSSRPLNPHGWRGRRGGENRASVESGEHATICGKDTNRAACPPPRNRHSENDRLRRSHLLKKVGTQHEVWGVFLLWCLSSCCRFVRRACATFRTPTEASRITVASKRPP